MADILRNCPSCSKTCRFPASAAGKKIRCPNCQTIFADRGEGVAPPIAIPKPPVAAPSPNAAFPNVTPQETSAPAINTGRASAGSSSSGSSGGSASGWAGWGGAGIAIFVILKVAIAVLRFSNTSYDYDYDYDEIDVAPYVEYEMPRAEFEPVYQDLDEVREGPYTYPLETEPAPEAPKPYEPSWNPQPYQGPTPHIPSSREANGLP